MDLSIVICTINRGYFLDSCLYCLSKQIFHRDFEIIIVDDGSKDNTREIVKNWEDQLNIKYIYIEKDKYSSPAVARNIGWKASSGKFISFTDPEQVIPFNVLRKCFEYHQLNKKSVTCLKPVMLEKKRNIQYFHDIQELFDTNLIELALENPENFTIGKRNSWRDNHFSMMPREALEEVNGVNENFSCWGFEGIDLIERIIKAGYKLYNFIDEGLFVYHQWHEVNRDMNKANEQRIQFGVKNCGLID